MISYYKDEGVRVVVADLVRVRIRVRAKYSEPAVACIQCNDALQTIYMDCTMSIEHVTVVYSFYTSC
jgi:hypothetical protein